ncbi:hypothetical protein CEXT_332761 [Caerostris extrusa]|uniref:Uncharacterized protein n=1 Tax=Caerostris extrusa TaxID=172846 RepID=A0AAV4S2X2_CAEEX|nr:hypothetical protein CEXT_332761 [Caerostris extrusa]
MPSLYILTKFDDIKCSLVGYSTYVNSRRWLRYNQSLREESSQIELIIPQQALPLPSSRLNDLNIEVPDRKQAPDSKDKWHTKSLREESSQIGLIIVPPTSPTPTNLLEFQKGRSRLLMEQDTCPFTFDGDFNKFHLKVPSLRFVLLRSFCESVTILYMKPRRILMEKDNQILREESSQIGLNIVPPTRPCPHQPLLEANDLNTKGAGQEPAPYSKAN